eukprot:1159877-Pelagomonas_calceolata.AAC.4
METSGPEQQDNVHASAGCWITITRKLHANELCASWWRWLCKSPPCALHIRSYVPEKVAVQSTADPAAASGKHKRGCASEAQGRPASFPGRPLSAYPLTPAHMHPNAAASGKRTRRCASEAQGHPASFPEAPGACTH